MSASVPISTPNIAAPTPQNTPLNQHPIALGLSRPTVPAISEEDPSISDDNAENITTDGVLSGLESHVADMVQGRLASLVGKSSGYIESLPVDILLNVQGLKGVQVKQIELHNQYKRECLELEKKYLDLHKPLYERRNAIITGISTATSEEIEAGEAVSLKDDDTYTPLVKDAPPSSNGIPEFWLTALRNHIALSDLITERDASALKHLVDVRLEYLKEDDANAAPGKAGFKIIFEFSSNDFFENNLLEKTYLYGEEVDYSGDFVYNRAIGTKIQWKDDKDLTKEFEIKKQRNKNTNRTRLVRKARSVDSFFNFFSPPVPENGEYSEEELMELEDTLMIDYQIGEDFKDKIIPRAIDFFTGKALEYEVDEDEEDDFEIDEDEDDAIDDSDSASGSESDSYIPVRHRGGGRRRGGPPTRGNSSNPEECKQQWGGEEQTIWGSKERIGSALFFSCYLFLIFFFESWFINTCIPSPSSLGGHAVLFFFSLSLTWNLFYTDPTLRSKYHLHNYN